MDAISLASTFDYSGINQDRNAPPDRPPAEKRGGGQ